MIDFIKQIYNHPTVQATLPGLKAAAMVTVGAVVGVVAAICGF